MREVARRGSVLTTGKSDQSTHLSTSPAFMLYFNQLNVVSLVIRVIFCVLGGRGREESPAGASFCVTVQSAHKTVGFVTIMFTFGLLKYPHRQTLSPPARFLLETFNEIRKIINLILSEHLTEISK